MTLLRNVVLVAGVLDVNRKEGNAIAIVTIAFPLSRKPQIPASPEQPRKGTPKDVTVGDRRKE